MNYDLAIIGAGWAGYNAAIRARELGLKVALIEKGDIGGACLNRGCIPTKTLIYSAKIYSLLKKSQDFGIEAKEARVNFCAMQSRKKKVILQLRQGMESMLKGIDILHSNARITAPETLDMGRETIQAKSILIATGARPTVLPDLKFDGQKIVSSDEILEIETIPEALLIVGGGVIGCEFASLFHALGSRVSIAEKLPRILPAEDEEVSKKIETIFRKKGIKIHTSCDVKTFSLQDFTLVLVCVGRTPENLTIGLDELGVRTERGRIVVDGYLKTNIGNIYAAGDCTGKLMLAHFAAYQGRIAAENIARKIPLRTAVETAVPNCIFSDPEIASIGLSETAARQQGIEIRIKRFDFMGCGMARILNETEGFIKVIAQERSGMVLGASIIGPRATELIGIFSLALHSGLKISDLQGLILAHPTLSESITESLRDDTAT